MLSLCVLSLCVWSYCMLSLCVLNYCCMCKEAGGGGGEGARDTESKTRTPHKDVGNNMMKVCMQETESVMSAPRHPVPWVPRLPRKTTVDVSLCHACHAKWRWMWVLPRLPRKAKVDVRLCHACHAKWRWTWVLPRLPRKAKVDVRLCHACHAKVRLCHACHVKSRWMSPSATPATQKWRGVTGVTAAPKPVQARHPVPSVPRLPRKTTVDVRLCHACHVKSRWMSPSATPATQKWRGGATPATQRWGCATPATWNQGGCHQVPRLPRRSGAASQASRRRLNQSKRATQCHLSHACHAKRR